MIVFLGVSFFVLGAIVGSFLNVVIYRLHTGKSLQGRSHCMSCGKKLTALELIPLISYLFLRSRCSACGAYIPIRYFVVELLTALSFLGLWIVFNGTLFAFGFYLIFISVLIVILVYDIRHTIIPDEMVLILLGLAFVYVIAAFLETKDWALIISSFGGAFGAALFFGGLWYLSKGRWMGLGDAKLAFPLGLIVGFSAAYSMIVFAFLLGAVVSVPLVVLQKQLKKGKTRLGYRFRELTIKSEVPFAPFLIAGFLLVEIFHADIFTLTFRLFFL